VPAREARLERRQQLIASARRLTSSWPRATKSACRNNRPGFSRVRLLPLAASELQNLVKGVAAALSRGFDERVLPTVERAGLPKCPTEITVAGGIPRVG